MKIDFTEQQLKLIHYMSCLTLSALTNLRIEAKADLIDIQKKIEKKCNVYEENL